MSAPVTDAAEAAAALLGSLDQPDPYPAYARLRSVAPVYVPPVGPVLVTSYAGVSAILHAPRPARTSTPGSGWSGCPTGATTQGCD